MNRTFGQWLRHELSQREMSQADLFRKMKAAGMRASTGAIADWANDRKTPTTRSVQDVADVLRVDVADPMIAAGHRRPEDREDIQVFQAQLEPHIRQLNDHDRETIIIVAEALAQRRA